MDASNTRGNILSILYHRMLALCKHATAPMTFACNDSFLVGVFPWSARMLLRLPLMVLSLHEDMMTAMGTWLSTQQRGTVLHADVPSPQIQLYRQQQPDDPGLTRTPSPNPHWTTCTLDFPPQQLPTSRHSTRMKTKHNAHREAEESQDRSRTPPRLPTISAK